MPPRLRFGDVEIDVDAFELRRGGTLCPVEPQVFELVCYLARNAGRLVTKDELIEAIWNGRIVSDATLASRIKSARRAIGDDGEQQKWIRTVHGRGLRFVGDSAPPGAAGGTTAEAATDAPPRPAIAVLPFECLSARPEPDYLADGLTEDIITDLSRVSGLLVVARNTVYAYRDKPINIRKVAEDLKVGYVLEGSIRRTDGRVRITAQLIDARSGGHVWAERYDRELSDIFALQDEISQSIVAALRITLLPEELAAITHRATSNTEAYQYYQMGRSYFLQTGWGRRAMLAARQMFERAAEIDPRYARAYAAIANCDSYLLCMGDPEASFETILANCALALALEPNLADAHAAKGLALFTAGRGEAASAALERAMSLAPDSFEAHFFAGRCERAQGRFARAAALFERAAELQPDDFRALGLAAYAYRSVGRHDEARAAARRCLERIEGELAVHADDSKALAFGAAILADLDQVARAREWVERAVGLDPADLLTNYNLACALVALGQHDAALGRLEKMFAVPAGTRRLHLDWMRHDIALVPLRDHPRYLALVRHLEQECAPAPVTELSKGRASHP